MDKKEAYASFFYYFSISKLNGNLKFFPLNTFIAAMIIITRLKIPIKETNGANANPTIIDIINKSN